PDARLGAAFWAHQLHVARMHRRLALDDATLDVALRVRLRVALDQVDTFDDQPVLVRLRAEDAPALATVLAGNDQDVVVLANQCSCRHIWTLSYSTSGASEMIFMNRRSRSSRATGPNTRVPIGSLLSLISTAALRSKRM